MRRIIILILSLISFLATNYAYAKVIGDTVYLDVEFLEPEITPSSYMPGYSHIEIEGLRSLGNVGEPVLPRKGLKVLLPPRKKVKDIEIVLGEKMTLPGMYLIEPGQKEYPLSQIGKIEIEPDKPNSEIYESASPYPAKLQRLVSFQRKMGYPIVAIELSPVEYNPKEGKVFYYKKMTVILRLESDVTVKSTEELKTTPKLRTKDKLREKDKKDILRLIDNKEDLSIFEQEALIPVETQKALGPITKDDYEYVIVTHKDFVSSLEPLKKRRIEKGLTANIVTTDWIYANYSGERPGGGTDNQTKIRNFIIDAYNNWGTSYVLLAGDGDGKDVGGESGDDIIPARGLSDTTILWYQDNNIPADLYYACLDGTFDYDKDGIYGEKTDGIDGGEIDLLAEIYVGRAPIDSLTEAENFVKKTLAYEGSTDKYLENSYMVGEYLGFGGVAEYATASMEEIRLGTDAHGYTTQGFLSNPDRALDADTLYDDPYWEWPKTELINIINNGIHILNHLGHAYVDYDMKLYNSDVDSLTNNKYFIVNSQGCYPGAFDNRGEEDYGASDCIGEHFTTNSTGAVAFIGNSRYGWGMGHSTAGSSQYYQRQYWDALFGEGMMELGKINQDSKEDNIPYLSYSMNRWCYFELNLFGDPALKVNLPDPLPLILDISNYSFIECEGNGDGRLNPRETGELIVTLRAFNQDAFNVSATLSSEDPCVTIEQSSSSYGIILKGESADNSTSPFRFRISQTSLSYEIKFTLAITAYGYKKDRKLLIKISDPHERQITTDRSDHWSPAISGNLIVWEDYRNGNPDIYLYDLSKGEERQITTDRSDHWSPAISGNLIVWEDYRNGYSDIYLYDLSTETEKRITTDKSNQCRPAISGNLIVWQDDRNGNWDIYLYDLSKGEERQITTDRSDHWSPAISGNLIVWEDWRNGNADIYLYDLSKGEERQITADRSCQIFPAISGNLIVWEDDRNGNWDIYLYDLSKGEERQITTDKSDHWSPAISGNLIVWQDAHNGNWDIYLYDLSKGEERQITTDKSNQCRPAISGNLIVWEDDRNGNWDIYLYDLNSPPVLDPISDKTIDEGKLLQFTVSATDPDGDELTYSVSNLPEGASFNPATHVFSWTPDYTQAGEYDVTFKVSDGKGGEDSEEITITVKDVNQPPIARILRIQPNPAYQGQRVYFAGYGKDKDGKVVDYEWKSSIDGLLSKSPYFSTNKLSIGKHTISFRVKDDKGSWSEEVRRELSVIGKNRRR